MEILATPERRPALPPPDPEQQAAAAARLQQRRDEIAAERAARAPERRAVLETGPELADVEAALECLCSCHPRTAEADLHAGGRTCPCQKTPEERSASLRRLTEASESIAESLAGHDDQFRQGLLARAADLGAEAHIAVPGAPFVISGRCQGVAFYLRERHGDYRVTVAEHPFDGDLWEASNDVDCLDIAAGPESDIYDAADPNGAAAAALGLAVAAIRAHLLRSRCEHLQRGDWAYCPECGTPSAGPAAPGDPPPAC